MKETFYCAWIIETGKLCLHHITASVHFGCWNLRFVWILISVLLHVLSTEVFCSHFLSFSFDVEQSRTPPNINNEKHYCKREIKTLRQWVTFNHWWPSQVLLIQMSNPAQYTYLQKYSIYIFVHFMNLAFQWTTDMSYSIWPCIDLILVLSPICKVIVLCLACYTCILVCLISYLICVHHKFIKGLLPFFNCDSSGHSRTSQVYTAVTCPQLHSCRLQQWFGYHLYLCAGVTRVWQGGIYIRS